MNTEEPQSQRRHRLLGAVPFIFAIIISAALATSVYTALGGFTATITNNGNTYSSGTLLLSESQGATTCLSTANPTAIVNNSNTCSGINLLGNPTQTNGDSAVTASTSIVTVENVGTLNSSALTLTPGACTASANSKTSPYAGSDTTGFCSKVDITIFNGTNCVYPAQSGACPALSNTYNLASLASKGALTLSALSANSSATYTFTVQLDSGVTNADQGLTATESFAWTLSQ
ncbi:MAG: hypothetical protein ACP5OR_04160 [Candidatus Dormibacteria bacterium]